MQQWCIVFKKDVWLRASFEQQRSQRKGVGTSVCAPGTYAQAICSCERRQALGKGVICCVSCTQWESRLNVLENFFLQGELEKVLLVPYR